MSGFNQPARTLAEQTLGRQSFLEGLSLAGQARNRAVAAAAEAKVSAELPVVEGLTMGSFVVLAETVQTQAY